MRKEDLALAEGVKTGIAILEQGVKLAAVALQENQHSDENLEGSDNGLYPNLIEVAVSHGYKVVDSDKLTKEILKDGRKGLRKRFFSGWVLMVKQGSPLQMTATLAHELAHHFTPPMTNENELQVSESTAEGVAFIVCDQFGLDIGKQAFSYIARYSRGTVTQDVKERIETIGCQIVASVRDIQRTKTVSSGS